MKYLKIDLKKHRFFIQPSNVESNASLVDLLGSHRVAEDEQRDQKCRDSGPQNEYEVTADELILAYNSSKGNQVLKFKYFVRFRSGDVLNPIQLIPDSDLSTRESLVILISTMLSRIRKGYVGFPKLKAKPAPGVFPMNVETEVRA